MRKVLLFLAAVALAYVPVAFTVRDAQARIGRPLTPFSVAGVHRRYVRRNFGVGANLGWRGVYHRRVAFARHPFVAGAALGAVYGVHRHYGGVYGAPHCACGAPGVGGYGSGLGYGYGAGWGAYGLGLRPGLGWGAPGFGWRRGWW